MHAMRRLMQLFEDLKTDSFAKIDPNDPWAPEMMPEPKVLYRSVSVPELADIWMRGDIQGGLNKFNDFDPRRYVLFGDKITDMLIWQGEEIERQVAHSLGNDPIHREFAALKIEMQDARHMLRLCLEGGKDFLSNTDIDQSTIDAAVAGRHDALVSVKQSVFRKSPTMHFIGDLQELLAHARKLSAKYQDLARAGYAPHKAKVAAYSFSSAILETKPIDGGVMYDDAKGKAQMDQSEYGFQPGEVTLNDIAKVHYVKDRKIISSGSPDGIGEQLNAAGFYGSDEGST